MLYTAYETSRMKPLIYLRRHGKNDNTPYLMGGMAGVLVFLILGVFSLSIINHYLLTSPSLASVISAVLVDLTNGDRTASNIGGLATSPVLTATAQAKVDDMAAKGYFAHVSPDGKDSWYWFKKEGYTFLYAGENLAVDFSDSADVERAWMNSPTHRANILDGHFTEIGIAVARGTYQGRSTTFVVQMFGTPSTQSNVVRGTPAPVRTLTSPSEPTSPALATTEPTTPTPVKSTRVAGAAATATMATNVATKSVLGVGAGAIVSAAPSASWWQYLLTSPKTMLRYAYFAIAGTMLILLAVVTEFEFHRRHLRHVAATLFLFVLMLGLFVFADVVFFAQPVIAALQT